MYRTKLEQAKSSDDMSTKKFNDQKEELTILAKSPQELIAMMPVSEQRNDLAQRPPALAIKSALDEIEAAKVRKEENIKEAVEILANLNLHEELMAVH